MLVEFDITYVADKAIYSRLTGETICLSLKIVGVFQLSKIGSWYKLTSFHQKCTISKEH